MTRPGGMREAIKLVWFDQTFLPRQPLGFVSMFVISTISIAIGFATMPRSSRVVFTINYACFDIAFVFGPRWNLALLLE